MKPAEERSFSPSGDHVIDEVAAAWLALRESGFKPAQAAEFARWRDADPRHAAAIRRAEATTSLLARLPETPAAAAMLAEVDALCSARTPTVPFSTLWKAGLAAAASVILFFVVTKPALTSANATYTAKAGHHQSIDLPDGSTLVLNPSSEVEVAFQDSERRVRLQHGEAHFYVAKDSSRPFLVNVGTVTVRAVGTAFNIRRQTAAVEVLVTEGKVEVRRHDQFATTSAAELKPIFLVAGERAFIDSVPAAALAVSRPTTPGLATSETASRAPRLMFNNTPLSDAVERFNRYSHLQMEIVDADLAERAVGGNFDADNADSFIHLLSVAGDVRVERVSETRVLLHKVQ